MVSSPKGINCMVSKNIYKNKIVIPVLWIIGAIAVCYGMVMDNDPVFIGGIICIIAGYVLIRKALSNSIKKKKSVD
jgi:hypothetical protein